MVAEVVERCYGGGGVGDQEQALLRRACVFLEAWQPAATKTLCQRERRVLGSRSTRSAANHAR